MRGIDPRTFRMSQELCPTLQSGRSTHWATSPTWELACFIFYFKFSKENNGVYISWRWWWMCDSICHSDSWHANRPAKRRFRTRGYLRLKEPYHFLFPYFMLIYRNANRWEWHGGGARGGGGGARVYTENTSDHDAWHIPRYPTRRHCITSMYYIEHTVRLGQEQEHFLKFPETENNCRYKGRDRSTILHLTW